MKEIVLRTLYFMLLLCCVWYNSTPAFAIDNPDTPDYVADFLKQDQRYKSEIMKTVNTTVGFISAYTAYEEFLDKELNKAYNSILDHLDKNTQWKLRNSQRKWLKYRDAEFEFIMLNWNRNKFGSSFVISRGDYRTKIIKNRIILLLSYSANYLP
jgi:uncharacterized protein YecT (DUF1311 family)